VLLNGAIKWGVKVQLAATNPVAAVGVPPVPRSKARALAPEEIARVLHVADETRWEPFITLAFATGMRRGELCALAWTDIDFQRATVLVERSLTETRDGAIMKTTKTGRSRTVPLSRMAVSALRRQSAMQAADRLRAKAGVYRDDPAEPLFTNEVGLRIAPMDATHAYARIAKEAKVTSLRLHDARHSAATHLLVAGVDVRSVSGILGHASATTTLGTYAHLVADAQRDGIDKLGDRLAAIIAEAQKSG
jgi:integrase